MSDAIAKLTEIFRVVLDLPPEAPVEGIERDATETWDSLATVSLVAAIESEFGLALDTAEIERLDSFATVAELVKGRVA